MITLAFGVLMAGLPSNQHFLVVCENTACESASNAGSQTSHTGENTGDEHLLLDTFANGNAVVTVNNGDEGTNSYRLISLVDGYSVRVDGV